MKIPVNLRIFKDHVEISTVTTKRYCAKKSASHIQSILHHCFFPSFSNLVSQSRMFGLSRNCRNLLRFSSFLHSARSITSAPHLINVKPVRIVNENARNVPIRSFSTDKSAGRPQLSKIQLIAPNLRKTNRRRRPLATLYKDVDNSLPKVVGLAKADSFDLTSIFEDEHFGSFYQVTYVDEGRLFMNLDLKFLNLDAEDALHIVQRSEYRITDSVKDAFVFNDGVVVAWNMNDEELSHLMDFLQPFEIDSYSFDLVQQERETIAFNYGTSR